MSTAWLRSSLGKKIVMAVSGFFLIGFVILHLLGNLLIYGGPDALNAYAEKLRHLGPMLWITRLVLLTAVFLHLITSMMLAKENRDARPVAYARKQALRTTFAARTMMFSGLMVIAFIVYHLLHFTFRVTNPAISNLTDALGRHDVYAMVVFSFREPAIVGAYLIAMALLCAHLSHGIASMFQTLGFNTDRTLPVIERLGHLVAGLLFLGYISIPVSVLLGWVKMPGGS